MGSMFGCIAKNAYLCNCKCLTNQLRKNWEGRLKSAKSSNKMSLRYLVPKRPM